MNVAGLLDERLPVAIRSVLRELGALAASRAERAYLVGGPVRDLLLRRPNLDMDIVIEGNAIAMAHAAALRLRALVEKAHEEFGTATIRLSDGQKIDLVTARAETYPCPAALPVVRPSTLAEDLARRDFTINALAVRLAPDSFGGLVDPHGGIGDLNDRVIRILHRRSFEDDPTRLFRAVRFEQRLSFHFSEDTDAASRAAIADGLPALLTGARVRQELLLLLDEANPTACLRRLGGMGLLSALAHPLPFDPADARRIEEAGRLLGEWSDLNPARRPALMASWLSRCPAPTVAEIARWLMLGNGIVAPIEAARRSAKAIRHAVTHDARPSEWHRLLHGMPIEACLAVAASLPEERRERLRDRWTWAQEVEPYVTGDDLRAFGFEPGPAFRPVLEATLVAQLDGEVRSAEAAREFARREMARRRGSR